ncbi:MAG: FkbM family methyltransferase [Candidatus Bathyarchaeota archaeon]|nr:FkbM family methyltransferase [Candidatus Bathyarchaeota archaeon]
MPDLPIIARKQTFRPYDFSKTRVCRVAQGNCALFPLFCRKYLNVAMLAIRMERLEKLKLAHARLKILKHWLESKRNGISMKEVLQNVLGRTYTMKAKSVIKKMNQAEAFLEVVFKDFEYPLYYPIEMPITSLYQVIAEVFYSNDWHYYEIEQTKVSREDTVIDCGAGEGLFSLLVARRCSKVYAIEPLPRFVQAMKLSFSKFSNANIIPCALADYEGEGKLSQMSISSSLAMLGDNTITIRINTVDNLFFEKGIKVDYIKADVEGYELEMLRGASNTIKSFDPKIAITTYHRDEHAKEISRFLKGINPNYKIKLKGLHARGTYVVLHAWIG